MFPPSLQDLAGILAALSVAFLLMSYVVSSLGGRMEMRIPRRDLERAGIILGAGFLAYAFVQIIFLAITLK